MRPTQQVLELPCQPSSVTRARHFVRDLLLEWNLPRLVEDAQLGTSELVANAVRHAGTDLQLTVTAGDDVVISVRDGDPQLRRPVAAEEDSLAESGRGLHIVAAVSSDWGITVAADGKMVWFALALPDGATVDADVLPMDARRTGRTSPRRGIEGRSDGDGRSVSGRLHTAV
ncbi:MAG TPA: ATP-binding protein [Acidimicrobiales bacterium]|nr:ATP-binding protein [Acidimicrobiales bacterium]